MWEAALVNHVIAPKRALEVLAPTLVFGTDPFGLDVSREGELNVGQGRGHLVDQGPVVATGQGSDDADRSAGRRCVICRVEKRVGRAMRKMNDPLGTLRKAGAKPLGLVVGCARDEPSPWNELVFVRMLCWLSLRVIGGEVVVVPVDQPRRGNAGGIGSKAGTWRDHHRVGVVRIGKASP